MESELFAHKRGAFTDALDSLEKYKYYGNVRELQNIIEKRVIEYNLKYFNGNRRKTAEVLKIGERTLRYKIKDYNIN